MRYCEETTQLPPPTSLLSPPLPCSAWLLSNDAGGKRPSLKFRRRERENERASMQPARKCAPCPLAHTRSLTARAGVCVVHLSATAGRRHRRCSAGARDSGASRLFASTNGHYLGRQTVDLEGAPHSIRLAFCCMRRERVSAQHGREVLKRRPRREGALWMCIRGALIDTTCV